MVLLERKVIAWAQSRLGPMRVGPYGILQPVADAVKLMIKEDITPVRADKWVFTAAPIISMVPALIVYAVIPFGPDGQPVRPPGVALHHRHQRRPALHRVGGLGRRLRHHPRGLRVEQQVPAARQPARVGAADQLRSRGDADAGQRDPDVRHAQHGRHRPRAGERARLVRVRAAGGVRASSSSAAWPRPTARRSTCRKRSRS